MHDTAPLLCLLGLIIVVLAAGTDGVSLSATNGLPTVQNMIVSKLASENLHAANKAYVDAKVNAAAAAVESKLELMMSTRSNFRIVAKQIAPTVIGEVVSIPSLPSGIIPVSRAIIGSAVTPTGIVQTLSFNEVDANNVEVYSHRRDPESMNVTVPAAANMLVIDVIQEDPAFQVQKFDATSPNQKILFQTAFSSAPSCYVGATYPQNQMWLAAVPSTTGINVSCRTQSGEENCSNTYLLAVAPSFTSFFGVLQRGTFVGTLAIEDLFTVTFDNEFAELPVVDVQVQNTAGSGLTYCGVVSTTTTGFTGMCYYHGTSTNILETVNWMAVLPGTHYL